MQEAHEQVKQEQEKKRRRLAQLQPKRAKPVVQRGRQRGQRPTEKPSQDADEEPPAKPLTFLSKQQVLDRIPVTAPTLWHWARTGQFPAPRYIGRRTVWILAEVEEWMRTRPLRNYKIVGVA